MEQVMMVFNYIPLNLLLFFVGTILAIYSEKSLLISCTEVFYGLDRTHTNTPIYPT